MNGTEQHEGEKENESMGWAGKKCARRRARCGAYLRVAVAVAIAILTGNKAPLNHRRATEIGS